MAVDWSAAPGSNAVGPDETPAVAAGSNAAVVTGAEVSRARRPQGHDAH